MYCHASTYAWPWFAWQEVRVFEEHGRNIFAASGIRGVLDVMDALLADQDLKGE